MTLFHFSLFLLIAFGVTGMLTEIVRRQLIAKSVMDMPSARSMHVVPVPRGGGLAVLSVVMAGLVGGMLLRPETLFAPAALLLPCLCALFFVSWWDDRFGARASVRLGVHVLAAGIAQFAFSSDHLLLDGLVPFYVERVFIVLGWAWFMNLYNFMDGIDGITGGQTICLASATGAMLFCFGVLDPSTGELVALLIGASAGFLLLNWHPARIFLGDVGSVPLGFLTAYLLLKLAFAGHVVPALIIPLYYLADSGMTLGRRILKGEKIWQPHRTHFYQRAAASVGRHDRVVLWILLSNMALFLAALVAISHPVLGIVLGGFVVVSLLGTMKYSAKGDGKSGI